MPASRILALARTMRCDNVGGAVRKARAISSVVRPQTSRRVSATRASGDRAGSQPVVCDALIVPLFLVLGAVVDLSGEDWQRGVEPGAPSNAVDGLEPAGRN